MATKVGNIRGPEGPAGANGDGATFITSSDGSVGIAGNGAEDTPYDLSAAGAHLIYAAGYTPYSASQGGPVQFPNDANTGKGTIVASSAATDVVLATWDATGVIEAGHGYTVTLDLPMKVQCDEDVPPSLVPIIRVFNTNLNPVPGGGSPFLPAAVRPLTDHIADYIDYRWVMTGYTATAPTNPWDVRLYYYASSSDGVTLPDVAYSISTLNIEVVDLGEYTP